MGSLKKKLGRTVKKTLGKKVTGEIGKVVGTLDRYVPGWATIIDVVGPALPILPLVTNTLAWVGRVAPAALEPAAKAVTGTLQIAATGRPAIGAVPSATQQAIASPLVAAAQGSVQALAPLRATLAKAADTYKKTQGDLLAKIEAISIEIASGLKTSFQLVSFALGPAGLAISAAIEAAWQGYAIGKAAYIAHEIRKEAHKAREQARREAAQLELEERALREEIARLRAARTRREAAALSPAGAGALVAGVALGILAAEVLS